MEVRKDLAILPLDRNPPRTQNSIVPDKREVSTRWLDGDAELMGLKSLHVVKVRNLPLSL